MIEYFTNHVKKILNHYLSEDVFKLKILEEEIDFTGPHGIKLSKWNEDSIMNISKELSAKKLAQKKGLQSDPDDLLTNLKSQESSANQINILNILDVSKMETLISEDSFLDLLSENFTTNILVQRNPPVSSHYNYLENCIECELKTVGKNLLFEIRNCDTNRYQMIVDKDGLFVNWHPIL